MRRLLVPLLFVLLLPCGVRAQLRPAPIPLRYALPAAAADTARAADGVLASPAVHVLASAVLPGAGQALQGNRRWVPYLALEVWAWIQFREYRADADALARRYRDVAWQVARRVSVGARRDTVFEYYEALAKDSVRSSGAFDASLSEPGVQPERELRTFNGELWVLAQQLFGGSEYGPGTPQYDAALAYYMERAIPPAYAWAWGSNDLEHRVFATLIHDSDEAYRKGTRMLGVILANHVASAVDALITARLHALSNGRANLETGLAPERKTLRFDAALRVRF